MLYKIILKYFKFFLNYQCNKQLKFQMEDTDSL